MVTYGRKLCRWGCCKRVLLRLHGLSERLPMLPAEGGDRAMSTVAAHGLEAAHKALKAVCSHACCVISLHGCPHGPWRKNGRLLEIMWGQIVGGG